MKYVKIWFSRGNQQTHSQIMEVHRLDQKSVEQVSEWFMYADPSIMLQLNVSRAYDTWEEALDVDTCSYPPQTERRQDAPASVWSRAKRVDASTHYTLTV